MSASQLGQLGRQSPSIEVKVVGGVARSGSANGVHGFGEVPPVRLRTAGLRILALLCRQIPSGLAGVGAVGLLRRWSPENGEANPRGAAGLDDAPQPAMA